jgi:hypothetical protein
MTSKGLKAWWQIAITTEPIHVRDRIRDEHVGEGD